MSQPNRSHFSRARPVAQAIVDAHGDVARQREIFAACPQELRALAREMAKSALALIAARTQALEENQRLTRQAAERDPAPLKPTIRISDLKQSSPEVGHARLAELRAILGQKEPRA